MLSSKPLSVAVDINPQLPRVEPLLYHGILLSDTVTAVQGFPKLDLDIVLRAIDEKPPEFLKYAVKHLLLDSHQQYYPLQRTALYFDTILKACTGITGLVAWTGVNDNLSTLASSESLRRLTIDIPEVFGPDPQNCFAHSLFRHITHLEIGDFLPSEFTGIALIPHLAHFAFNAVGRCDVLRPAFHSCARLTCIVFLCAVVVAETKIFMNFVQPLLEDERFVMIISHRDF
ncbi:hypothetical protein DFH07DRAFT_957631 [Mycena maculata]|uniref:Uncharacterized protein n=1 Tax=Mycena maculata TaxID=230809 RepID=A0AAD7J9P1_9AGAR|nr:hypothetical protein DFH07DRAFT_957631 [Mycena maculata]